MERRNRITLRDVKYNVGGTKGDISTIWPVRIKSEGFPDSQHRRYHKCTFPRMN